MGRARTRPESDPCGCTSATDCKAVGTSDVDHGPVDHLLAEHWNGTSWSITQIPTPTHGDLYVSMYGISCTSVTSCTAVGEFGYGPPNPTQSPAAVPIIEHWDGTTWSIAAPATAAPPMTGTSLFGVTCTDQTGCIAVGVGWGGITSVAPNMYLELTDNLYTLVERDT